MPQSEKQRRRMSKGGGKRAFGRMIRTSRPYELFGLLFPSLLGKPPTAYGKMERYNLGNRRHRRHDRGSRTNSDQ